MSEQHVLFTPDGGPTRDEDVYPAESGRGYYVTAVDGAGRVAAVAGPYERHADALARVTQASDVAYRLDPKSWFYAWGTSLLMTRKPGALNKYIEGDGQ